MVGKVVKLIPGMKEEKGFSKEVTHRLMCDCEYCPMKKEEE